MNTVKKCKIVIAVLSVFLAVSIGLLIVQFVRKTVLSSDEATVKNNSIGAVEKDWVFRCENLLPGDSATKDYAVTFRLEKDAAVAFRAVIDRDESQFAKVLHILVEDTASGATVCEGKLSEVAGHAFSDTVRRESDVQKTLTYRITITVDPAAGNEYRGAEIAMHFCWSLGEAGDGQ